MSFITLSLLSEFISATAKPFDDNTVGEMEDGTQLCHYFFLIFFILGPLAEIYF